MKIIYIIIFSIFTTSLYADWRNQAVGKSLNDISEKTTKFVSGLIPGEGLTEVDISARDNNYLRLNKDGNNSFQFSILGVRDIVSKKSSNLFTQFSLHNQDINDDQRIIGNLGLGYRFLNSDQSMMLGANTFYDQDLSEGHKRVGAGFEAKAAMLDFNYNLYQKTTNMKVVSGSKEQTLSGQEYNISSQIPYMPWTTFN